MFRPVRPVRAQVRRPRRSGLAARSAAALAPTASTGSHLRPVRLRAARRGRRLSRQRPRADHPRTAPARPGRHAADRGSAGPQTISAAPPPARRCAGIASGHGHLKEQELQVLGDVAADSGISSVSSRSASVHWPVAVQYGGGVVVQHSGETWRRSERPSGPLAVLGRLERLGEPPSGAQQVHPVRGRPDHVFDARRLQRQGKRGVERGNSGVDVPRPCQYDPERRQAMRVLRDRSGPRPWGPPAWPAAGFRRIRRSASARWPARPAPEPAGPTPGRPQAARRPAWRRGRRPAGRPGLPLIAPEPFEQTRPVGEVGDIVARQHVGDPARGPIRMTGPARGPGPLPPARAGRASQRAGKVGRQDVATIGLGIGTSHDAEPGGQQGRGRGFVGQPADASAGPAGPDLSRPARPAPRPAAMQPPAFSGQQLGPDHLPDQRVPERIAVIVRHQQPRVTASRTASTSESSDIGTVAISSSCDIPPSARLTWSTTAFAGAGRA